MHFPFYVYYAGLDPTVLIWIKELVDLLYIKSGGKEAQVVLGALKNTESISNCFVVQDPSDHLDPLHYCISHKFMYFIVLENPGIGVEEFYQNVLDGIEMPRIKVGSSGH